MSQNIKIRIKRHDELEERREFKRVGCKITKTDTTKELKKDGKITKPVEVTTKTRECDLATRD